jgi:hypothetical protein
LYKVTKERLFQRFKAAGEIVPLLAMKAEGGLDALAKRKHSLLVLGIKQLLPDRQDHGLVYY